MPQPTLIVPSPVIEAIRDKIAALGEKRASRELGLSPLTIARVLAGLPVSRGTLLQLNQALAA